jgi:hypothetical protein
MTQHKVTGKVKAESASVLSPGKKAQKTARWARIMTKWLITYTRQRGVKWNLVEFGGKTGSESRGIVDLVAIRKNHKTSQSGLKQGDLFDIILIQVKGGGTKRPSISDIERLVQVAAYHHARAIVLAEWQKGRSLVFYRLANLTWQEVDPVEIFG